MRCSRLARGAAPGPSSPSSPRPLCVGFHPCSCPGYILPPGRGLALAFVPARLHIHHRSFPTVLPFARCSHSSKLGDGCTSGPQACRVSVEKQVLKRVQRRATKSIRKLRPYNLDKKAGCRGTSHFHREWEALFFLHTKQDRASTHRISPAREGGIKEAALVSTLPGGTLPGLGRGYRPLFPLIHSENNNLKKSCTPWISKC